jgi:hypothetical protein
VVPSMPSAVECWNISWMHLYWCTQTCIGVVWFVVGMHGPSSMCFLTGPMWCADFGRRTRLSISVAWIDELCLYDALQVGAS